MLSGILIVLALSVDAFAACIAYGASNIKIPLKCAAVISFVGTAFLSVSVFAASVIERFVPPAFFKGAGFCILLCMGISSLFTGTVKNYLKSKTAHRKELSFSASDINFVLQVFLDETKADIDMSKTLSIKESLYLSAALSIDSLIAGFGGFLGAHAALMLCASFALGLAAVLLGCFVGGKIAVKSSFSLSWLSGLILIGIAISKLFE